MDQKEVLIERMKNEVEAFRLGNKHTQAKKLTRALTFLQKDEPIKAAEALTIGKNMPWKDGLTFCLLRGELFYLGESFKPAIDAFVLASKYCLILKDHQKLAELDIRIPQLKKEKWKKIPHNLEECFVALEKLLSAEDLEFIRNSSWKDRLELHRFGLGLWIRNNWHLWDNDCPLKKSLAKQSQDFFMDADGMSVFILDEFAHHLRNKFGGKKDSLDEPDNDYCPGHK